MWIPIISLLSQRSISTSLKPLCAKGKHGEEGKENHCSWLPSTLEIWELLLLGLSYLLIKRTRTEDFGKNLKD